MVPELDAQPSPESNLSSANCKDVSAERGRGPSRLSRAGSPRAIPVRLQGTGVVDSREGNRKLGSQQVREINLCTTMEKLPGDYEMKGNIQILHTETLRREQWY